MINRFNLSEITLPRLVSAVGRRIKDFPHWYTWNGSEKPTVENRKRITAYKNTHVGKRCYIIANGPSLKNMDLSFLKNEITFGMNRIYLLFDQIPFKPTYYVCVNELVVEEFTGDIRSLSMPKFLNWNCRKLFDIDDPSTMFLRFNLDIRDKFGLFPEKKLYSGGTVTFACLQIAYYMGFSEVILIGLDHNYTEKGTPNKVEVRQNNIDESHFHPNYFPKGIKWQLPDIFRSELAYALARDAYEKDGRRILDATVNGKCTVFEKINYDDIFQASALNLECKSFYDDGKY